MTRFLPIAAILALGTSGYLDKAQALPLGLSNGATHWNSATLQGIRDAKLGAPMVARALAIVHTCMYDAWAAYDPLALGTQFGEALRQPRIARTPQGRSE